MGQLGHNVKYEYYPNPTFHFLDIVHRDLKLENILLSHPVGNELLNIKVIIIRLGTLKSIFHLLVSSGIKRLP